MRSERARAYLAGAGLTFVAAFVVVDFVAGLIALSFGVGWVSAR